MRLIESKEAFVVKCKIKFINPVKVTPGKEGRDDFSSISFGVDAGVVVNGTMYPNAINMQATGDNIATIESLNVGDQCLIAYNIKGTLKADPEMAATPKNQKKEKIFTNLNAYDVEILVPAVAAPAPTTTPTAASPAASSEAVDDLPF